MIYSNIYYDIWLSTQTSLFLCGTIYITRWHIRTRHLIHSQNLARSLLIDYPSISYQWSWVASLYDSIRMVGSHSNLNNSGDKKINQFNVIHMPILLRDWCTLSLILEWPQSSLCKILKYPNNIFLVQVSWCFHTPSSTMCHGICGMRHGLLWKTGTCT